MPETHTVRVEVDFNACRETDSFTDRYVCDGVGDKRFDSDNEPELERAGGDTRAVSVDVEFRIVSAAERNAGKVDVVDSDVRVERVQRLDERVGREVELEIITGFVIADDDRKARWILIVAGVGADRSPDNRLI